MLDLAIREALDNLPKDLEPVREVLLDQDKLEYTHISAELTKGGKIEFTY